MASTSNIRAFVQWKEATIFSGEEIECVITFKNTAVVRDADERGAGGMGGIGGTGGGTGAAAGPGGMEETENNNIRLNGGLRPRIERQRTVTQSTGVSRGQFSTTPSLAGTGSRVPSYTKGHRPTLSLSVVPSPTPHSRSPSLAATTPQTASRPVPRHGRSLSIMSLQSEAQAPSPVQSHHSPSMPPPRRPAARGHGRSASVQVMSRSSAASVQPSPVIGP